eukprot:TRINITY_DN1586_c0_g2_i1.p2 TRINITY_DN1586_c0_g2~~TRINITY_DN1586_c0_g2_i1.p2  ORF type:complete len:381 (+),score=111.58 TRINITY_DN1586_c0_g2_i1:47-1144(+)
MPAVLQVIDPANRTGKICIPVEKTHDTLGREELEKNSKKHISLCLLYQQKKCHAGQKCNQIHADRWYIQKLRRAPSKEGTCCPRHGVSAGVEGVKLAKVVLRVNGCEEPLPVECVARTAFFDRLRRGGTATLTVKNVCRLHQQDGCKFGHNCKNVHLCREIGRRVFGKPSGTGEKPVCVAPVPEPLLPAEECVPCVATPASCTLAARRASDVPALRRDSVGSWATARADAPTPRADDDARRVSVGGWSDVSWQNARGGVSPSGSAESGALYAASSASPRRATLPEVLPPPSPPRRSRGLTAVCAPEAGGLTGLLATPPRRPRGLTALSPSDDVDLRAGFDELAGSLEAFRAALVPQPRDMSARAI